MASQTARFRPQNEPFGRTKRHVSGLNLPHGVFGHGFAGRWLHICNYAGGSFSPPVVCFKLGWRGGRLHVAGRISALRRHQNVGRKHCRKMPGKWLCAATIIDLGQNQARFSPFWGVRPLPNRAIVITLQSKTRASRRKGRKADGRQSECGRPHVKKRISLIR